MLYVYSEALSLVISGFVKFIFMALRYHIISRLLMFLSAPHHSPGVVFPPCCGASPQDASLPRLVSPRPWMLKALLLLLLPPLANFYRLRRGNKANVSQFKDEIIAFQNRRLSHYLKHNDDLTTGLRSVTFSFITNRRREKRIRVRKISFVGIITRTDASGGLFAALVAL